jgi:hypothetical protein
VDADAAGQEHALGKWKHRLSVLAAGFAVCRRLMTGP